MIKMHCVKFSKNNKYLFENTSGEVTGEVTEADMGAVNIY